MPNPNRAKGKRWEHKNEKAWQDAGVPVEMLKDGYADDYGDLLLWRNFAVVQCKDAQAKRWTEWADELEEQRINAEAFYKILSVKQKGKAAPDTGLHLVPLPNLIQLVKAAKWAHDHGYSPDSNGVDVTSSSGDGQER